MCLNLASRCSGGRPVGLSHDWGFGWLERFGCYSTNTSTDTNNAAANANANLMLLLLRILSLIITNIKTNCIKINTNY